MSRGHVSSTFDRTVCLEIVDFLHEARCTFASRFDRSIRQGFAIIFLRARTRSQRNCKRGDFKIAVVDSCNLNVAVLAGGDSKGVLLAEPHHVLASVGTSCSGRLVLFQRNNYIRLRCATARNRIVETSHALFTAAVRCGQGIAGNGDSDFGIVLRNFQFAKLLCNFVVGCLGIVVQSIVEGIVAFTHFGLRTGNVVGRTFAGDKAANRVTFTGRYSNCIIGQCSAVPFLLVACRDQSDRALGDGVFCLAGCSLRGCGVGLRLVLIDNGQIVGILADGAIGFDFHVRGSLELGMLRTPRTSRFSCGDGIGVFFVIRILDLDDNINECVLAFVFAGHELVCLGGDIRKHIDASAVIDLGGRCVGDGRRCDGDSNRRVRDDDKGVFFFLVADSCAFVGRLGAAIVVVLDVKFNDQLFAAIAVIRALAAPVISIIEAGNFKKGIVILRLDCQIRYRGICTPSILAGIIGRLGGDILCICRNLKIFGEFVEQDRSPIQRGRVIRDILADGVENLFQRICRAAGCLIIAAVASRAEVNAIMVPMVYVITAIAFCRLRIIRGHTVHVAVDFSAGITRVRRVDHGNGVDLRAFILEFPGFRNGITRNTIIIVLIIRRLTVREHDHDFSARLHIC